MRISFLLGAAYGTGGTTRATLTVANQLAERHDVEIITAWRRQRDPFFPIDERIAVRTLMDQRPEVRPGRLDAMLGRHDSRLVPRSDRMWSRITMRGDYRLWRALRSLDTDVLISTRPAFNLLAARFAPRNLILVGQEHLHLGAHRDDLREHLRRRYPRLDALVTLTGTGPERDRLRATAADHGLGARVEFKGRTRDIHAAFAKASAVAVSSSYEGFGTTIIEAFACGVPVASVDCPHGPREIITHGRNGLLVPEGDVDALADALIDLITHPARRQAMGAAARATATHYDAATIAGHWETLLTDLQALRRPR